MIRCCLAALAVILATTLYSASIYGASEGALHVGLAVAVGFIAGMLTVLEFLGVPGRRQ